MSHGGNGRAYDPTRTQICQKSGCQWYLDLDRRIGRLDGMGHGGSQVMLTTREGEMEDGKFWARFDNGN